MKIKYNRPTIFPVICHDCYRYIWMEPYGKVDVWHYWLGRWVKKTVCNECLKKYKRSDKIIEKINDGKNVKSRRIKMDAVKYLEEKKRMIESLGGSDGRCTSVDCYRCPLSAKKNGKNVTCIELNIKYPKTAIEIIEKWSEEHPRKILLDDFLEKYPNAMLLANGIPKDICPVHLGYDNKQYCIDKSLDKVNCVTCWNRTLEEVE